MPSYPVIPNRAAVAALVCCAALLVGCAKPDDRAGGEETAASKVEAAPPAPATPTTPATISLAAVAGKWKMRSMDLSGANVLEYELTATADSSNWTVVGPGGRTVPVRVVIVAGDSIVTDAGPYESFVRKGVQVRQRDTYRLRDGMLVSMMEGQYSTQRGDSLTRRRSEGTRVP